MRTLTPSLCVSEHDSCSDLLSQHHCRNCGKSVCTQCSTKRAPLPEFGIKQPTRVCDLCYKKVNPGGGDSASASTSSSKGGGESAGGSGDLPEEYLRSSLAKESQVPSGGHSEEIKMREEDDLQLAIAMSLNEQDNKVSVSAGDLLSCEVCLPPPLEEDSLLLQEGAIPCPPSLVHCPLGPSSLHPLPLLIHRTGSCQHSEPVYLFLL